MKKMQFGSYVFPYNPARLKIMMGCLQAVHTLPMQGQLRQSLGRGLTRVEGEGELFGNQAEQLKQYLTGCLHGQKRELLLLPECEPFLAVLTQLELIGKGGREGYGYRFVFMEENSAGQKGRKFSVLPYSVV